MSRRAAISFGFAALLVACNQDPGSDNGKGIGEPAPCPDCVLKATAPYPAGPYAASQGSIINDFAFQGFIDASKQSATLDTIKLQDFYNPHADDATYQPLDAAHDDRLFPPGSPYGAGTKKPTALLIDIASVWCGPCNEEAKSLLNGLYAKYKPCGGEFLFQLAEGSAPGTSVDQPMLKSWVSAYHVTYPATFDPGKQLFSLFSAGFFPDGAVVEPTSLRPPRWTTPTASS
jgi:hypothetical protein